MAAKANVNKDRYLELYKDEIEKILGREIDTDNFESYDEVIKDIMESFHGDSEKERLASSIMNWWGGNSENSKSKRLSRNFDKTGKIKIDSPSKILNEFLEGQNDLDKNNFKALLDNDEFLKQTIFQKIVAWQTDYIANSQVKKYNLSRSEEISRYVSSAKEGIHQSLNDGEIREYLEEEDKAFERRNQNLYNFDDLPQERVDELVKLAQQMVEDGRVTSGNLSEKFENLDELKSLTDSEKNVFEMKVTQYELYSSLKEAEENQPKEESKESRENMQENENTENKEQKDKEFAEKIRRVYWLASVMYDRGEVDLSNVDGILNSDDRLKDLSENEKKAFKASVENCENDKKMGIDEASWLASAMYNNGEVNLSNVDEILNSDDRLKDFSEDKKKAFKASIESFEKDKNMKRSEPTSTPKEDKEKNENTENKEQKDKEFAEKIRRVYWLASVMYDRGEVDLSNVDGILNSDDRLKDLSENEKKAFKASVENCENNKKMGIDEASWLASAMYNNGEVNLSNVDEILNSDDRLKDFSEDKKKAFKASIESFEKDKNMKRSGPTSEEEIENIDEKVTDASNVTSGENVTNGISNEWKDKYDAIDKRINSVEDNIRKIIKRHAYPNKIQLSKKGNLETDVLTVYDELKKRNRGFAESFAEEINDELENINKVKEEIAKEYIKVTEEGIKLLRKTVEDIKIVEDEIAAEQKELEGMNDELSEKETELSKLEEKDPRTPEEEMRRKELAGEIADLKNKIGKVEKSIKANNEKLEGLKKDFEETKNAYLDAADRVKNALEEKGISIGNKSKDVQKEEGTAKDAKGANDNVKANNSQAAPAAQQAASNTTQQTAKEEEKLPVKNDAVINMTANYNQIIEKMSESPIGSGLDRDGYNKVISSFKQIITSPNDLTSSQKRKIKDIFTKGRKDILNEMKDTAKDKKVVEGIKRIIGEDNMGLFGNELTGKGELLKDKGLGLDEMTKDDAKKLEDAISKCYAALADEKTSKEDINIITDNILKPIKFACADQCAAITTRSKIQQFFGIGRKALDKKTSVIAKFIKEKEEEFAKTLEKRNPSSAKEQQEPTKEEQEVQKTEPTNENRSFRDMLGDLINSKEDVDLKSKLGYEVKQTKIDWDKNKSQSKPQSR